MKLFSNKKKQRQQEREVTAGQELLQLCSTPPIDDQQVRKIIQEHPNAVKTRNPKGDLAIHLACFHGASLQTIEYLVKSYPESLKLTDEQGSLPLHWACFGSSSLLLIKNLLLQYPESVSQKTLNGQVALHYACNGHGRLDVARILVDKWRDALQTQNGSGLLPLHVAVGSRQSSLELVQFLVQQYPASLQMRTNHDELPVDRAITCEAPTVVVEYLQQVMEKQQKRTASAVAATSVSNIADNDASMKSIATVTSTVAQDIESQLLHACSEPNVTVEQIAPLLQRDPNAIMCKTLKGMRPLHICCWKGASFQVVEYLIEQWPESTRAKTTREWVPLHVACASDHTSTGQLQVIQCLIQHDEDSVKAKDNKDRIPLHVACFSRATVDVVQYLVDVWPDSIMAMNNFASLPLHLACGTRARLDVIQYLVNSRPESLQAVDSEGRTPLDMAREPLQSDNPDLETVAWLEDVMAGLEQAKAKREGTFDKERSKLQQVISREKDKPVAVSPAYVETIMDTSAPLGKGYFGVVFLGDDTVLKQKFAIKSINRKILLGGGKDDLELVKKEFKKEQKGLLRFRHPNIALLYGYCLSDSQRKGEYLLYELAEKGSLDSFWNSQIGRERLSSFGRRAQIALNAFIGLRFLHVGNKYIKPCFHRDIKSANIVLKTDMTAQLIDVGLATFSHTDESPSETTMMSTGVKGTRGYVCPKYCTGSIAYDASCDIFSFGIVLAELWSGYLQNHFDPNGRVYNYYEQYINDGQSMDDDLDKAFGFGVGDKIPLIMNEYKHLALDCMAKSPKRRPSGEDVMDRLEIIWHSFHSSSSESGTELDSREVSMDDSYTSKGESDDNELEAESDEDSEGDEIQVNTSGDDIVYEEDRTSSVEGDGEDDTGPVQDDGQEDGILVADGADATGSDEEMTMDVVTCRLCRTYTADEGWDECLMCLALQQQRDIIAKAVSVELDADSTTAHDFEYPRHAQADPAIPFSPHIDLRLNNPIPRLFTIVPEALKGGWKHPRLWLRRQVATRYHLFFICGYTYQVIHPPIRMTVSSAWIEKIGLSIGVSLTLLKMAAEKVGSLNGDYPSGLKLDQLDEILDEVKAILKDQGDRLHILECIRTGIRLSDEDISLLNGDAYELICEKAREDRDWRKNMEPVRKEGNPHIVWVSNVVTLDRDSEYKVINV